MAGRGPRLRLVPSLGGVLWLVLSLGGVLWPVVVLWPVEVLRCGAGGVSGVEGRGWHRGPQRVRPSPVVCPVREGWLVRLPVPPARRSRAVAVAGAVLAWCAVAGASAGRCCGRSRVTVPVGCLGWGARIGWLVTDAAVQVLFPGFVTDAVVLVLFPGFVTDAVVPVLFPGFVTDAVVPVPFPGFVTDAAVPVLFPGFVTDAAVPVLFPGFVTDAVVLVLFPGFVTDAVVLVLWPGFVTVAADATGAPCADRSRAVAVAGAVLGWCRPWVVPSLGGVL